MKKILFNGLGNRGWIGGLYYLKNIIFSCLESEKIKKEYRIVVLIDSAHADIFTCFGNRIDLHIYDGTNKAKLALYEICLLYTSSLMRHFRWAVSSRAGRPALPCWTHRIRTARPEKRRITLSLRTISRAA